MSLFSSTAETIIAGNEVRCDLLVFFDFTTTPMRVWAGMGELNTLDGHTWSGIGDLGSIGELEGDAGGVAAQTTFTLSGVSPTVIAKALNQSDEVKNRRVNVYLQFFNEAFQCLDNPYAIWSGLMDTMSIDQAANGGDCIITVNAEGLFSERSRPPFGFVTEEDQQRLFPTSQGLWEVPYMVNRTVIWPLIPPQP